MPDRVTRFAADLVDAATVEGARRSRSAKAQLDHWARVGRALTAHDTTVAQRVDAALGGTLPLAELGTDEGAVFNAEISARIDERLAAVDTAALLGARGLVVAVLNPDGNIVRRRPDGSTC